MNPPPLLPLLLLLLSSIASTTLSQSSFCSTHCSHLSNVSFPFGTRNGCGSPGFLLDCSGDQPLWITPSGALLYLINIIQSDYPGPGKVLVRGKSMSNCSLVTSDDVVTPDPAPGVYADDNTVYLLFRCKKLPTDGGLASSHCTQFYNYCSAEQGITSPPLCLEVSKPDSNTSSLLAEHQCDAYTTIYNVSSTEQQLSMPPSFGMELLWQNLPYDVKACETCRNSSGSCGYDVDDKSFRCICGQLGQSSKTDCNHLGCGGHLCSKPAKAGLAVGIILAVAIVAGLSVFCFCMRRRNAITKTTANFEPNYDLDLVQILANQIGPLPTKLFTYKELDDATKSFSESRMIGDGGFGAVYEGRLYDGRKVAVKKLYHENHRRLEQFFNEVRILSCLQHPNLVKLFGFCLDDKDLLLVYEYVSNGTLADHLHGDSGKGMSWEIRLNIALDTADALCYLHYLVNPPIFHRDVKSSNILLDERFHAKVADFGLSRLVPLDATHVSTVPQGTPGYLDPDYHQCYQLTQKSDVYSFGVVLMEIISARLPVDMSRHKKEINLATFAVAKIQNGELDEFVDPILEISIYPTIREMVTRVAELGCKCLSLEKDDRPTMKEVAEELESIKQVGYEEETKTDAASFLHYKERSKLQASIPRSPTSVQVLWPSSSSASPDMSTSDVKYL